MAQNENGSNCCDHAFRLGYTEVVRLLLENGANLRAIDDRGYTPLNYAVDFSKWKYSFMYRGIQINFVDPLFHRPTINY